MKEYLYFIMGFLIVWFRHDIWDFIIDIIYLFKKNGKEN